MRCLLLIPLLVLTVFGEGCVSPPRLEHGGAPLPPPPSESVRRSIRQVIVAHGGRRPELLVAIPYLNPDGMAARGAAGGLQTGLAMTGQAAGEATGDLAGAAVVLVGVVVIPAATIYGAVSGHSKRHLAEASNRARRDLIDVVKSLPIQQSMQERITRCGAAAGTQRGFSSAGPSPPSASSLSPSGAAVLSVDVVRFGLRKVDHSAESDTELPPFRGPYECFVRAQVILLERPGGRVLYAHEWEQRSGSGSLAHWAANQAQPFRAGIDACQRGLAEKVVDELFLVYVPPKRGRR